MIQLRWYHLMEHDDQPVLQYRVMQDTSAYSNPFSDAPFTKKMEWSEWLMVPHVYEKDFDPAKDAYRSLRKGE